MANPRHVAILKRGAEAWNKWRRRSNTCPNLRGAFLDHAVLPEVELCGADLDEADLGYSYLNDAYFTGASLRDANLIGASLAGANLCDADLKGANLSFADLSDAWLGDAWLSRTCLAGANFWGADLFGADLTEARLGRTVFAATLLQQVEGLETCIHDGPSVIDIETAAISEPLPLAFLRGCGLHEAYIDLLMATKKSILHSCFISYSHADKAFADQLYKSLQDAGVRCWIDEKKLLPGDDIHGHVDRGIRTSDRVLLCCSESALTSWWVDNEIAIVFEKERQLAKRRRRKIPILIPLDLDGYVLSGKWKGAYRSEIRRRFTADFKGWNTDPKVFTEQVDRVIRALAGRPSGRPS